MQNNNMVETHSETDRLPGGVAAVDVERLIVTPSVMSNPQRCVLSTTSDFINPGNGLADEKLNIGGSRLLSCIRRGICCCAGAGGGRNVGAGNCRLKEKNAK